MNNLKIALIILLTASHLLNAQNLVPNPSFEETENCDIQGLDYLEYSVGWYNPTISTPDLYCNFPCAIELTDQVLNDSQLPLPQFGNCCAGLFIACIGDSSRDYFQIQLNQPLESGAPYHFSLWLAISPTLGYRANGLGIYLSNDPITTNSFQVMNVQPQWEYLGSPLSPIGTWHEISGEFIAEGGENYLTIGCFRFNEQIEMEPIPDITASSECAYYAIDNVLLEKVLAVNEFSPAQLVDVKSYDGRLHLTIKSANESIEVGLYSVSGQILFRRSLNADPGFISDEFSSGLYILHVKSETFNYKTKIFID